MPDLDCACAVRDAAQAECDAHGSRLLSRFAEARKVERMVSEVRGRRKPAAAMVGGAAGRDGGPDARQVGGW